MALQVTHTTRFRYSHRIAETFMELRVRPRDDMRQRCLDFNLQVEPSSPVNSYRDGFNNWVHYFNHLPPHEEVVVTSRSAVETGPAVGDPGDGFADDFMFFRPPVENVAGVRKIAQRLGHPALDDPAAVEAVLDELARDIHARFEYEPDTTSVYTGVAEVIKLRRGVCQDFAHLYIAVCRVMSIPARYVSGYIAPGGERIGTAASHAWAEAWIPGQGWVGYDPTNPVRIGTQHVAVAVGRDYQDVAPTRGVYVGTADESMEVEVNVVPLAARGAGTVRRP